MSININEIITTIKSNQFLLALAGTIGIPLLLIIIGKVLEIVYNLIAELLSAFTSRKFIYLLFSHLTFIGVWHHELSHALFGFLSGAKIHKITLFKVEGNTLGSVESSPRGPYLMQGLQMALISIGPVVMGFITLYLLRTYAYDLRPEMWYKAIMVYLMVSIFLQMSLSPQDIKVFKKDI